MGKVLICKTSGPVGFAQGLLDHVISLSLCLSLSLSLSFILVSAEIETWINKANQDRSTSK